MSDERQEVTTRRDDHRPVNGFRGKTVHIWGFGGFGSWIAEFVARAGAATITVCDPGTITGGLLVRQNYTDDDIGQTKAKALAARLRAIRDDLTVNVAEGSVPDDPASFIAADFILDATDASTGTLGIVNICAPGTKLAPSEIDKRAGLSALDDGKLGLYHPLWQDTADGDEIVPTRGCSVPTFHGSPADLAAVAATLVSLMGAHPQQSEAIPSGTHLIALPHTAPGLRHHFIPAETDNAA